MVKKKYPHLEDVPGAVTYSLHKSELPWSDKVCNTRFRSVSRLKEYRLTGVYPTQFISEDYIKHTIPQQRLRY